MMASQILKIVDFTKTQKSGYLESKTLFFLRIKIFINYTSRATLWQKIVQQRRQPLKFHTFIGMCSLFHMVQSANTEFQLMKTRRVLTDRANVRYRKNQVLLHFYDKFTIKKLKKLRTIFEIFINKNLIQNSAKFKSGFYQGVLIVYQL